MTVLKHTIVHPPQKPKCWRGGGSLMTEVAWTSRHFLGARRFMCLTLEPPYCSFHVADVTWALEPGDVCMRRKLSRSTASRWWISANGFSSRKWSERSPGLPLQPAVGSAPLLSPNCTCRRKAWKSTMMICASWTRFGEAALAVWKAQPCALALFNQTIGNDFGFTVTSGSSGLHIVWSLCNDLTSGWRLKKKHTYFYLTFQISRFSARTFPLLEVC